jgi:hypothetical protein
MKTLRFIVISLLLFIGNFTTYGQMFDLLDEYKASDGVTYKVGDEVKLGKGSGRNGVFVYVNIGGWAVSSNPEANHLGAANSGLLVTIKKIKQFETKRNKGVVFVVGGGNITNYNLNIEEAISTGEVATEGYTEDKALEELKKAKDKLDLGLITQEEYDEIKRNLVKFIK